MILRPLKYYLSDYIKKLALATIASIAFGLFLLGPLADSFKEKMMFINWAISVTLYGTFFYAYPLQNISKWYMNTPLAKSTWFYFNCIFQLSKLLLTFVVFVSILVVEKSLYPVSPMAEVNNDYQVNSTILAYAQEFLSSSMVGLMLTFLTLFLCFVFNVDPYGPFRAGIIPFTKEGFKEEWKRWWASLSKKQMAQAGATVVVFLFIGSLITDWIYSKALLVAIINTLAISLVVLTYDRAFTFTRPFQKKVAIILVVHFFVTWQGMMAYSRWMTSTPLSVGMQLQEFEFQGKRFSANEYEKAKTLLMGPELTSRDIQRLIFLAEKSFPLKINHPMSEMLRFDSLLSHPFADVDMEKVCLSKQNTSGLLECLNLILTTQLTPTAIDHLLDHLWALEGKDDLSNIKNLQRLLYYKITYTESDLKKFLMSNNPYKQFIALSLIDRQNAMPLLYTSGTWFKGIQEVNLPLAREVVSKATCYPVHDIDLIQGTFLRSRHPASCALSDKFRELNGI